MRRQLRIRSTRGARTGVAALVAAALCLGCQSGLPDGAKIKETLDVRDKLTWKAKEEGPPPPQVPARVVTTWVHAVRHQAGNKPERGFGGRIVFFGQNADEPVRVDGQLVVYAFEEDGREDYETQPTKRFIFPAKTLAAHEGESALGPSYSVWLGWDEVGGPQRNISLITRFEPEGGPIVVGEQTRHLLPGVEQQIAQGPTPTPATGDRSILQASYTELQPTAAATPEPQPTRLTQPSTASTASTTINLPDSLKQRLQQIRTQQAALREVEKGTPSVPLAPKSPAIRRPSATDATIPAPAATPEASQRVSRLPKSALDSTVGSYVKGAPARGRPAGVVH